MSFTASDFFLPKIPEQMSAVTLGSAQCVNYNCVPRKGREEHVLLEFQRSVVIACGFREGRWFWFVDVQKFTEAT